jgi:DNA-binding response OmpR family regulator
MPHRAHPILLIEDDLSLSSSLCQFLSDHGYRTLCAPTARQGWDLLRSARPRLCLLDLNLPDGSGLDLLKRIAQHQFALSVVVMTAFDLLHLRPAEANGVLAAWLTKPVNPLELLKVVERLMRDEGKAKTTDQPPVS